MYKILISIICLITLSGCAQTISLPETKPEEIQTPNSVLETDDTVVNDTTDLKTMPVTAKDESEMAKKTLINFFDYLSNNEFEKAISLFQLDDKYSPLDTYSPVEDQGDKIKEMKNYCNAVGTCLKAKVLSVKQVANYEYSLTVQFVNQDGSIFVLGPCCGATEEQMPPVDTFDFIVKKINGEFKVVTPPVYRP